MQIRTTILVGAILTVSQAISGCVTVGNASAAETNEALAAPNVANKALVYFMAPQIGGHILNIAVDNRAVGKVKDRTFVHCYFDPGRYQLKTDGQFPIMGEWVVAMDLEPNETYYILTPYGPARFNESVSSRQVLHDYYTLSKSSACD